MVMTALIYTKLFLFKLVLKLIIQSVKNGPVMITLSTT